MREKSRAKQLSSTRRFRTPTIGMMMMHEEGDKKVAAAPRQESLAINEDELRAEAQEIRELEQKKRALEERVASMEKDLGGLLQ